MKIEEGRLVERVCPDCGNVERRAFGESESHRGELASYAIGWTSGHDDVVGHMTVGIGVGNPGGGSFHIQLRMSGDDWAMGLVDEPFEDVPEGGPDLTREQALAHDTLDYVWWVADNVMLQDRRALWMEHWLRRTPALATAYVVHDEAPVQAVHRDADGGWILLHDEATKDELQPFHLFHAIDRDQALLPALELDPGGSWRRP